MDALFSETSPSIGFPVYRQTMCERSGRYDGLGIRYAATVLCVECYRQDFRLDRLAPRGRAIMSAGTCGEQT